VQNHALEMMGGLVMGVEVRDRGVVQASNEPTARRRLRLVASIDSGGTISEPAFGYVLHEGARTTPSTGPLLPGPTIVLKRGEPVSIMIVNKLNEATAVHWHGIELDSYYDGVAGFAGHPGRIAPAIAPRDSFEPGSRRLARERSSIIRMPTRCANSRPACPARSSWSTR
jgi:hypothetical protein